MVPGRGTAALALVAASGCLILPETERTEIGHYTHESDVKATRPIPAVAVRPDGPSLHVQAEWKRTCTQWHSEIVEYREKKVAGLGDMDVWASCSGDCGKALLVGLLVAPITLAVSGLITAIIISKSDSTTRREVKSRSPVSGPCDAPGAGFRLRVSVRGMPDVAAVTDADGRARIDLPAPTAASAGQAIVVHTDAPRGVRPVVIRRGPPGASR